MALLPTTNFSVASDSLSASQGNDNKQIFSGKSFEELCLSNCLVAEAMVELLVHMVGIYKCNDILLSYNIIII